MRLQRITELVYHRPWLITPQAHESIRGLIERKLSSDDTQAGFFDDFVVSRKEPKVENGVGIVHIMGPIGIGLSSIEKTCGSTDLNDLGDEIDAVQKEGATRLMLVVDSPGGTVGGVPEMADKIANLSIPAFAYVPPGGMNCSAAYYLTVGCDRIYASPSADVGSIGVYLPWVDRTAAFAAMGYSVELITNKEGDLKGAGYPGTSLTDEQRANLQEGVQQVFDDFAAHVRACRPDSMKDDSMRGQSFLAREAYDRGLIDGVTDYDSAMRTLRNFRCR